MLAIVLGTNGRAGEGRAKNQAGRPVRPPPSPRATEASALAGTRTPGNPCPSAGLVPEWA